MIIGILKKAGDAKELTGIGQEKEIVALAYNSALAKKVGNGDSTAVTAGDLNDELTNQGATASESNPIKVTFTDSKRQYTVDNGIVDYAGIKTDNPSGEGLEGLSDAEVALLPTGVTEKTIENISNENLKDNTKIKAVITDSDNGEVPIPKDANYIEGTEKTGIVIEYKGSQFVWVPINNDLTVKGTTKLMAKESTGDYAGTTNGLTNYEGILYDFVTKRMNIGPQGQPLGYTVTPIEDPQPMESYGQGTNSFSEPNIVSKYDEQDLTILKSNTNNESLTETYIGAIGYTTTALWKAELQGSYNFMIESVKKYGGFYVGRYETSVNGSTVASVSGVLPMTEETNSGNMWYGMYQKQKSFSGNKAGDTMQSNMIWGSQYDAMLNWMLSGEESSKVKATTNGNHNGNNAVNTGATSTDIINNIYDLEGNCYEWTAEAEAPNDSSFRIYRGGAYKGTSGATAGFREWWYPNAATSTIVSSRIALYIK